MVCLQMKTFYVTEHLCAIVFAAKIELQNSYIFYSCITFETC